MRVCFNNMEPYEAILQSYHDRQLPDAKDELEIAFIERKLSHSRDVLHAGEILMDMIPDFADSDDAELIRKAKIALLLHDLGRFYQFKDGKFDHGMDHGHIGAELIRHTENISDPEIYHAVNVHDKISFDEMFNHPEYQSFDDKMKERTYLLARLVKDADMYANLKLRTEIDVVMPVRLIDGLSFTPEVMTAFNENRLVNRYDVKTWSDVYVSIFAWTSAFNFDETKHLIVANDLFGKLLVLFRKYIETKKRKKEIDPTVIANAVNVAEDIGKTLRERGYL